MIDYSKTPAHMGDEMRLYIEKGILPRSFLRAVLSNDFVEAVRQADYINTLRIYDWADFLYNQLPVVSWGSEEKMLAY
ncbi:hypothetical protein LCGC14_1881740 [marine sediment metagenome]|uniref:Uncharacterized protein n=1 Tax=marine sediment metagenome TaxID=412755 RepID=A0A0F9G233_9ZZZZ